MTPDEDRRNALLRGEDCPFCAPRSPDTPFWRQIATLSISTLYLDRNQTYRGQCLLVFDARHAVGLESLTRDEGDALFSDLRRAAAAITAVCGPDLMNYASLGNVVPHVHWHVVPRYRTDPRWGGPIYTTTRAEMRETLLSAAAYQELIDGIQRALAATR